MAIFSNQVWFSNRRAKWRRHQRMNLLQPSQHPPGSSSAAGPLESGQIATNQQHPPHQPEDRQRVTSSSQRSPQQHRQQVAHQLFGIRGQRRPTPVCIRAGSPASTSRRSSCSPLQRPQPPPPDETSADSTTNELTLLNGDYYSTTGDDSDDDGNCSDSEQESDISVVSHHRRGEDEGQQEEALDLKKTRSTSSPSSEGATTVSGR